MKGGGDPIGSRFEPELIDPSFQRSMFRSDKGRLPIQPPRRIVIGLLVVASWGWAASTAKTMSACLSLSPFRALPALGGIQPSPEELRDKVVSSLGPLLDSNWVVRPAGSCPEHQAILDVFQMPADIVSSTDGPTLRIRLEWHHQPGQTEFFLSCPGRALPPVAAIAEQLRAVAQQMTAQVDFHSTPEGADLNISGLAGPGEQLQTPLTLKMPPGVLSVEFSRDGLVRRKDTLVSTGGLYDIHADFRRSRIAPETMPAPRRTWPWWAATSASLLATLCLQWEQNQAQQAYSDLGATATSRQFDSKWRDLRRANLLRNGFLGLTLVVGAGSAWLQWGQTR